MSKIYQLVNHEDGSRSPHFACPSFEVLAQLLAPQVEKYPERANDFILVVLEDADGEPYPSRAPMVRISSIIALHNTREVSQS